MKKILYTAFLFVLVLFLTKLANEAPPPALAGETFALKGQRVVSCTSEEVVLVGAHEQATRLEKDDSWPACSTFASGDTLDFYLSRGSKTHFVSYERTGWWRTIFR